MAASKLFIFVLIFICLGSTFVFLGEVDIVLERLSDYKNRDYFIEKLGKDVDFLHGTKGGGTSAASVKIDGEEYVFRSENIDDFYITDNSKIDENFECYVLFNAKNEHVILIRKGEKLDFKERMIHQIRRCAKFAMLWIAALTFSFLYYRLVDKRITKKWKESEKQRNAR